MGELRRGSGSELVASREFQREVAHGGTSDALGKGFRFASRSYGGPSAPALEDGDSGHLDDEVMDQQTWAALDGLAVLFSRYSDVPLQSIDGLSKLQELIFEAHENNITLPRQTQQKLALLETELQALHASRAANVTRRVREEEKFLEVADCELVDAKAQTDEARLHRDLAHIERDSRVLEAEAAAENRRQNIRFEAGRRKNDEALMAKVLFNDRLRKNLGVWSERRQIILSALRPAQKWILRILIVAGFLMLAQGTYGLVVEAAGNTVPGFAEPGNSLRHTVFDSLISRK